MATLKDDLASLKIDHGDRAGGNRRVVWVVAALLLIVGMGGGGWLLSRGMQAAEVRTAEVVAQSGGSSTSGLAVLNASGYVTARRRATVSSKVTWKVVDVLVEEGQPVRKGQVLARLDDAQLRAGLVVARAQLTAARSSAAEDEARLKEAERQFGRLSQLVKDKVVGVAEVETAEATVESLQARIALARQQVDVAQAQVAAREIDLTDMVVRAPFDGVAISKDAQPGEMISPVSAGGGFTRTGICTIVDMSSLEIEVDVSENYINRVKPDQPVEAVLDSYADWQIPAHVITTVPSADRQKATVRVRIAFEKLDPRILPDMGVKVSFLNERSPDQPDTPARPRIFVPKGAVRTDNGQTVVFVIKENVAERRAVKTGQASGEQLEIVSGLATGERIVVEGPQTLAQGSQVKER